MKTNAKYLNHTACDSCGSSDGKAVYDDNSTYCFVCKAFTRDSKMIDPVNLHNVGTYENIQAFCNEIPERKIMRNTCMRYGVTQNDEGYYFPYHDNAGDAVAWKVRSKTEKKFSILGNWKGSSELFGQNLFPKASAKAITIVEGEFDALAAFEMQGSKYPVVSIRNGAASALKDCQAQYEYLDSFEKIVLCFDADEPGKEASKAVAELFGSKVCIMKHKETYKDACDYKVAGDSKSFVENWWAAERFVPDGIISGSSLWNLVTEPLVAADVEYPYVGMNKLTFGIRKGELVTVTAGSGLGKSQFLREIVYHILHNCSDNIGLMFLEESVKKTARSLMSLSANKPLHLPGYEVTDEEMQNSFNDTMGTDRLYFFDHFGSTGIDNIISRVKYLAKGLNCKYVFLDHVSIVVSSQENGDERKALDEIMTKLRQLVQETGICLFAVSHLKRPEGKGHEEGTATSLSQLRGSGSIGQLSDIVIGLERNGQHEDERERHTTHVRILKNRFSGLTGKACSLLYSLHTGRMNETFAEKEL